MGRATFNRFVYVNAKFIYQSAQRTLLLYNYLFAVNFGSSQWFDAYARLPSSTQAGSPTGSRNVLSKKIEPEGDI
jgi:hypothetical protein